MHNLKRLLRKEERRQGKPYVNSKGKLVKPKQIGPDCNCKKMCFEEVPISMRKALFQEYYNLSNYEQQSLYLYNLMDISQTDNANQKRSRSVKYRIRHNGFNATICKKAFMSIFGITHSRILQLFREEERDSFEDRRGKHNTANRRSLSAEEISDVKQFLMQKLIECQYQFSSQYGVAAHTKLTTVYNNNTTKKPISTWHMRGIYYDFLGTMKWENAILDLASGGAEGNKKFSHLDLTTKNRIHDEKRTKRMVNDNLEMNSSETTTKKNKKKDVNTWPNRNSEPKNITEDALKNGNAPEDTDVKMTKTRKRPRKQRDPVKFNLDHFLQNLEVKNLAEDSMADDSYQEVVGEEKVLVDNGYAKSSKKMKKRDSKNEGKDAIDIVLNDEVDMRKEKKKKKKMQFNNCEALNNVKNDESPNDIDKEKHKLDAEANENETNSQNIDIVLNDEVDMRKKKKKKKMQFNNCEALNNVKNDESPNFIEKEKHKLAADANENETNSQNIIEMDSESREVRRKKKKIKLVNSSDEVVIVRKENKYKIKNNNDGNEQDELNRPI